MRKARKASISVVAVLALAVAFAVPAGAVAAGAEASGAPIATEAKKKKCKKGKKSAAAAKKRCKKRGGGGGGGGGGYLQGRYFGNYAEIPAELRFNVAGGRLYTGPFDAFHVRTTCFNSSGVGSPVYTEVVRITPVSAAIDAGGQFSGSGVYPTGSGRFIPWTIRGQIQGGSISSGVIDVGPYPDFAGDPCRGTGHFVANWFSPHTL